jgi:prepilin-type N-terminal cleavage/methylation domain-containing protein
MRARGFSLVEMVVVVAILLTMSAVALPAFRPMLAESHLVGAGQAFRTQFRLAASAAIRSNVYTAIRFEARGDATWYAVYQDGDRDGVRADDIASGRDKRISGPFPLTSGAPSVRVGINPGVPAIPPDSGLLSGDPIQFGRSDTLSFSPLGTATPGTIYLAGDGMQAAIRVTGGSARVRILFWQDGRWLSR